MTAATRRPISVCLATYNGERYVAEQLASILAECQSDDEIIVVDDGSRDRTLAIIAEFADPRVQVLVNPVNLGPQQTFGRALALARHGTIFMSDQDDVWVPGRVAAMLAALESSGADLLASNSRYVDGLGNPIPFPMPPLLASQSADRLGNIARIFRGRAGYYGCAIALRAEFRRLVLPVPRFMESHDLWMALVANAVGQVVHLEAVTLNRRIHGQNVSVVRRPVGRRVAARVRFAVALLVAAVRRARV